MTYKTHKHYEAAYRAHYNTSHTPDVRAESFCKGFDADIENLKELGVPQTKIDKYESLAVAHLGARSRCMSSMITGPANFPVARNEKANNVERKRSDECVDYYNKIVAHAKKEAYYLAHPEARPVMSGDSDALERLQTKLEGLQAYQEEMRAVNKAHRAFLKNPDSLEKSKLSEEQKKRIRNYVPAYSWEPNPFAPFQLTNNNASIKRIKGRIAEITNRKESTPQEITVNGVTVSENTELMRLQLFFDGKPSAEIRTVLKSNGFKWAPSQNAWQRLLNGNAIGAFKHNILPALKELETA